MCERVAPEAPCKAAWLSAYFCVSELSFCQTPGIHIIHNLRGIFADADAIARHKVCDVP